MEFLEGWVGDQNRKGGLIFSGTTHLVEPLNILFFIRLNAHHFWKKTKHHCSHSFTQPLQPISWHTKNRLTDNWEIDLQSTCSTVDTNSVNNPLPHAYNQCQIHTFFLSLFIGNSWSGASLNTAFITDFHLKWSTGKKITLHNDFWITVITYFLPTTEHVHID